MDPVGGRVAVLVLRVTATGRGASARPDTRILVSIVERLPPFGEPVHPQRYDAASIDEALDAVRAWLERVTP